MPRLELDDLLCVICSLKPPDIIAPSLACCTTMPHHHHHHHSRHSFLGRVYHLATSGTSVWLRFDGGVLASTHRRKGRAIGLKTREVIMLHVARCCRRDRHRASCFHWPSLAGRPFLLEPPHFPQGPRLAWRLI